MSPTRRNPPATRPANVFADVFAALESRLDADLQKPYRALLDDADKARKDLPPLPWPPWSGDREEQQRRHAAWVHGWRRAVECLSTIASQLENDKARDAASRADAAALEPLIADAYRQVDDGDWAGADITIVRIEVALQRILLAPTQRGRGPGGWLPVVEALVAQYPEATPPEIVDRLGALAAEGHTIESYVKRYRPSAFTPAPLPASITSTSPARARASSVPSPSTESSG
jgi:hypothetical protein